MPGPCWPDPLSRTRTRLQQPCNPMTVRPRMRPRREWGLAVTLDQGSPAARATAPQTKSAEAPEKNRPLHGADQCIPPHRRPICAKPPLSGRVLTPSSRRLPSVFASASRSFIARPILTESTWTEVLARAGAISNWRVGPTRFGSNLDDSGHEGTLAAAG
jgi:hypothetical protein